MGKKIEELKSMTQEELILLVQDLQEKLDVKTKDCSMWFSEYTKTQERYNNLKNIIKGVVNIIEQ